MPCKTGSNSSMVGAEILMGYCAASNKTMYLRGCNSFLYLTTWTPSSMTRADCNENCLTLTDTGRRDCVSTTAMSYSAYLIIIIFFKKRRQSMKRVVRKRKGLSETGIAIRIKQELKFQILQKAKVFPFKNIPSLMEGNTTTNQYCTASCNFTS